MINNKIPKQLIFAAYLPYKTYVMVPDEKEPCLLESVSPQSIFIDSRCDYPFEEVKLILRPTWQILKSLEINGETFVPSDRTMVGMQHGRMSMAIGIVQNRLNTNTISYWDMQYLLSLHFDVFGQIELEQAIDMSLIEKPYLQVKPIDKGPHHSNEPKQEF